MTIVLDASGAVEVALNLPGAAGFKNSLHQADLILAPDTFVSEVTNVFWKYRQFSNFSDETCLKGIEFCVGLVDNFVHSKELWREAYAEGIKHKTPTYDMFYLVVARRNSGVLLSVDKRLNAIAAKEGLRAHQ